MFVSVQCAVVKGLSSEAQPLVKLDSCEVGGAQTLSVASPCAETGHAICKTFVWAFQTGRKTKRDWQLSFRRDQEIQERRRSETSP